MKYRRLGKTNLRASVVGVGTWQFGGEWGRDFEQKEVDQILERARELGINLVDTAECYGDHLSESLVGQAIRREREHWIIATKFGHRYAGHLRREQLWSVDAVQAQLERSLRALQAEIIDLYQFHSGDDRAFDNDRLWTMLDKQIEAGKLRFLGVSISSGIDPRHQVERASTVGVSVIQVLYNRLDRGPEETILPVCQAQDLGTLVRVPLAGGLLSGKYEPGAQFTNPGDVRASWDDQRTQERLRQVAQIQAEEVPADIPLASWALAWCLQHPAVTCVIPGCKSVEQVEANASAAELASAHHPLGA